ncbi:TetR/AcrR family transcriptional regulator [Pedobacter panaciterrae]|uniref:TetR/AcrR family transcriptional regulator n=1 Tax=Pedobacter panaciterrae TaxID=363849 RepID=A0ABU8NHH6_9SPHI
MNQRKRPYKRRNPELTKQTLVDTVGQILTEQGYQGLGVNKIGYRAGVSKKMIYWYFDSYNDLIRAYIRARDFWRPVFERFGLAKPPKKEELPDYISDIFQEQFKSFYNNPELQKMILWQISEPNAMLRKISEEREAEAEPIAELTDSHFKDSDINFRAVLALVLGGIYYVVWHANTNKSKVCGIDINQERDREALQKAIRQVIHSVWKSAATEQKK